MFLSSARVRLLQYKAGSVQTSLCVGLNFRLTEDVRVTLSRCVFGPRVGGVEVVGGVWPSRQSR